MSDESKEAKDHPAREGLPGQQGYNREEQEPAEPVRKKGGAKGGDEDSGGEAGEGSQSTGNPDSAG